jgi:hypothetical protein
MLIMSYFFAIAPKAVNFPHYDRAELSFAGVFRAPNITHLFGPLGYKAIFKMRYFKVNFIKIAWL